MTKPGIPNEYVFSTACFGPRLRTIEDQAFSAVAMGFRRLELGLSDTPPALVGWEDSSRETGIRVDSVMVGSLKPRAEVMSGSFLGSSNAEKRELALNSTRRHINLAQQLGAPVVVVRGCAVEDRGLASEAERLVGELEKAGEDDIEGVRESVVEFVHRVQTKGQRQLEHFCRSLHTLRSEYPDTLLAIEPGRQFIDLLNFEAMQWALDDLAGQHVGYWHDTGRVHERGRAGLPDQGAWLDAFSPRMLGCHLHDVTAQEAEMPPGTGEVDFKLVSEYLPQGASRVIEMHPRHGRAEVLAAVNFLLGVGI